MRPLDEQNHYEALEVPTDASAEEIERAYRMARASFGDDSMALYSVFETGDAGVIRERLDLAYKVLSDVAERRCYDEQINAQPGLGAEDDVDGQPAEAPRPTATSVTVVAPLEAFDEIEEDDEAREFDGARLRRARLRRGIELEQVAKVTKINPNYLKFLEEESYADLPAAVYVRGFLTAYAKAIGIDANHVASTYLARMEAAGETKRPTRLLGRR